MPGMLRTSECFLCAFDNLQQEGPLGVNKEGRRPGSALLRPCCLPSVHTKCGLACNACLCKPYLQVDASRLYKDAQEAFKKMYLQVDASRASPEFKMQRIPSKNVSASRCIQSFGLTRPAADLLLIEVWGSRSVAGR